MKLEPGKYYRTRGGRKVLIVATFDPFDDDSRYPCIGYVEGIGNECWQADGIYSMAGAAQLDLVAEWVDEPIPSQDDAPNYEPKLNSIFNPYGGELDVQWKNDEGGWCTGTIVQVDDPYRRPVLMEQMIDSSKAFLVQHSCTGTLELIFESRLQRRTLRIEMGVHAG